MCDTSLSNQRRYAPRVAEMTGLGGRFDRNTHLQNPNPLGVLFSQHYTFVNFSNTILRINSENVFRCRQASSLMSW
jgi:hypothetical protein